MDILLHAPSILLFCTEIMAQLPATPPVGAAGPPADPNASKLPGPLDSPSNPNAPIKNDKITYIVMGAVGGGILFMAVLIYAVRKVFLKPTKGFDNRYGHEQGEAPEMVVTETPGETPMVGKTMQEVPAAQPTYAQIASQQPLVPEAVSIPSSKDK